MALDNMWPPELDIECSQYTRDKQGVRVLEPGVYTS